MSALSNATAVQEPARTGVSSNSAREHAADWMVAIASAMIGAGGLLLGIQIDAAGKLSGTGFTALAIGALLALLALLARIGSSGRLPRDTISALWIASSFFGLAFVIAGVLAPGGPWMFSEVLVLLVVFALRRPRAEASTRWISGGSLCLLGLMLLFRLWITYQGSEHRWQVLSVSIPVLSWIPLAWLEPIQSVSLGSFTPHELGFPPAGLNFPLTMTLWALGFSLCAAGLGLGQGAAHEHENDRVHDLICTLPPPLAALVERLIPEEEWQALGLHGLSERRQCKKIERLVAERMQRQRELQSAFEASAALRIADASEFSSDIQRALVQLEESSARKAASSRGDRDQA
jgi:hypothetical protein